MTTYYKGEVFRGSDGKYYTNDLDGSGFTDIYTTTTPKLPTDYKNVIVVDSNGNGDYTSLIDALNSISDSSATNRYTILLFGRHVLASFTWSKSYVDLFGFGTIIAGSSSGRTITFTNTGLVTISNVIFEVTMALAVSTNALLDIRNCTIDSQARATAAGSTLNLYNCSVQSINSQNATSTLRAFSTKINMLSAGVTLTGAIRLYNCDVVNLNGTYAFRLTSYSSVLELNNCRVTVGKGYGVSLEHPDCKLFTRGGVIDAENADSMSAVFLYTPCTVSCIGTIFKGWGPLNDIYGAAVVSEQVFTDAGFYHCVFKNGLYNVTCKAGTANGNSVYF